MTPPPNTTDDLAAGAGESATIPPLPSASWESCTNSMSVRTFCLATEFSICLSSAYSLGGGGFAPPPGENELESRAPLCPPETDDRDTRDFLAMRGTGDGLGGGVEPHGRPDPPGLGCSCISCISSGRIRLPRLPAVPPGRNRCTLPIAMALRRGDVEPRAGLSLPPESPIPPPPEGDAEREGTPVAPLSRSWLGSPPNRPEPCSPSPSGPLGPSGFKLMPLFLLCPSARAAMVAWFSASIANNALSAPRFISGAAPGSAASEGSCSVEAASTTCLASSSGMPMPASSEEVSCLMLFSRTP
mmetsp:Transcript_14026/g.33598  ORF Transcript_14026/g.33598 Transcript_14026/m.33598 type:complete len:301 (-) Transcript_14026:1990-2892(-)